MRTPAPAPTPSSAPQGTTRIVLTGILALAVAMGIGRFAFTPLLPLMLRDGNLDGAGGAEWAAANYIGYLLGAITAPRIGRDPVWGLRVALWGVALTTFAVGVLAGPQLNAAGAVLRLAAGVFSAWCLVCASSWCLAELARRGAAQRSAWVYTGVGFGICITGVLTWAGGAQPARALWLELGAVAAAGALLASLQRLETSTPPVAPHSATRGTAPAAPGRWALVFCYGSFGFGYIVPATFLPAMGRAQVADPAVFGISWPLFGLAAALSVAAAARWLARRPRRTVWALAQASMALGTGVLLVSQALWALAISAVLVGGTFMVATMAGLQLAREHAPENPTPLLARMTVAFALGQIAGPLLVRALGPARYGGHDALWWSNAAATGLLALTAVWLALPARARLPAHPSGEST
ncbi:YbfB/YjiJ family MFS transporter [Ramlibacter sp. AN1015]|uniref:YbfB/YjiJ family MFS transporter n=1 Tax=Ramlibacter sp. AN1015 TaxID=3133428 RepID=UPI0030C0BDD1